MMNIFMNKFILLLLSVILFFYSAFTLAISSKMLISPEPSVLCDRYICVDSITGVSVSLTEKYLGKKQANRLLSQGLFDKTAFTFDNGVFCDIKERKCYIDRYFNEKGQRSKVCQQYTEKLFSN
ncbi:YcgJ family protein [Arsenophonus nasoniae]|uniref:YcgJ family protein n=1 Tax=Arsenophonus nasoniae TaxID=638 RepID=A0AA95GH23_9GAMM|nr:YcgJ family protein [Arsenophonus nasoniae]WGL96203.1 YcgJ family protein [Arsenophonus nasoniae]